MKLFFSFIVLNIIYITAVTSRDIHNGNFQDASILVMGLSGAGVFSTVEKLVKSPIQKNESLTGLVTEYSWPVFMDRGEEMRKIRVAWTPGLVNGKSMQEDARTIANVREYLQSPLGLNKGSPSIVIIVARFDDTVDERDERTSPFVRMLKTVEVLKDLLSSDNLPSNVIFHFTHLMGKGINEAKLPNKRIDKFRNIITKYTDFPGPILTTVGENRPDDYGLIPVGGYTRLPNKQLYPENLINSMKQALTERGDSTAHEIVTKAYRDPYNSPIPEINTFSTNEDDEITEMENNALDSSGKNTDINKTLQLAYNNLDEDLKDSHPEILQLVQGVFQRLNITTRDHLPKTTVKIVELFQKLPFHMASLVLVQDAFKLRQPEFPYPPVVGQGYDVLKDTTIPRSPFIINNFQPTTIGFSLPDILICKKMDGNIENFKLVQSYEEYRENRLRDLGIQEQMNSTVFVGDIRSSYNNIRADPDDFVALTAVKEIRNFKLDLIESSELDEEFRSDVINLIPFNQSDRESPKEWKAFFNKYGTHIVSEAFGGGSMEGKASGESIKNNLRYNTVLYGIKDNLLSFKSLPHGVNRRNIEIFHSFFGGSPDPKLADAHKIMPASIRENLLRQWKDSVKSDPRISELKLKLTPISTIAQLVDENQGHEIGKSLKHLFNGTLVYVRHRSPVRPPNRRLSANATTENPFVYNPSRRATTTSTTIPPQCDPDRCPEPPPCPMCPPLLSVYPTCSPCSEPTFETVQEKPVETNVKDFTKNVLGQGYHILTDTVLSGTPFLLETEREKGVLVPHGTVVTPMTTPCTYRRFDRIPTHQEYVNKRINSIYKPLIDLSPEGGITKYVGSVRPGYNVMENLASNGPFSTYEENRYFTVKADLKRFHLSAVFKADVLKLPSYLDTFSSCTIQEKWLDFFEKYGTHVITEAYAGTWENVAYNGLDDKKIDSMVRARNPNYSSGDCTPLPSREKQGVKNAAVAIESAKLETLKKVISDMGMPRNNKLVAEYDFVLTDMLDNRLQRC